MSAGAKTIIYPARDLAAAKELFSGLLGTPPAQDTPYYVGFEVAGQTIGLDPTGHKKGMTGPVPYFEVDDIEASVRRLLDGGGKTQQEPRDVGGGKLIAIVTDADGNAVGLAQTP